MKDYRDPTSQNLKHTGYWFKKDIKTIKNSLRKTLKIAPLFLVPSAILYIIVSQSTELSADYNLILKIILPFFLILLLGYFLVNVLITKGYDIGKDEGSGTGGL